MSAWATLLRIPGRFLVMGAFLFAGVLKAGPLLSRLPVDLTLLAAGGLAWVLLRAWIRGRRAASGRGLGLIGLWYATFLPGAALAAPTSYAFQKVATLFSFSLLASLAPFVLLRDREDLRPFLDAVALLCLVLTADGLMGAGGGAQRLETAGGGTIALGRSAGFLFLFGALLLARPGPLSLPILGLTGTAAVAAVFSGSRGPMAGAALALVLTFAVGRRGAGTAVRKLLLCGGGLALVVGLSLALAPPGSLRRTSSFLRGEFGASEQYRAVAARASWDRLGSQPWGAGWGGFAALVDLDGGTVRQYPHNLLLEVTFESGWACGACTALVLGAALGAARARTDRTEGRILFAGLVFWVINALVSGDVNDNRPLFAFVSAALCLGAP
jgi:hypothetical protein